MNTAFVIGNGESRKAIDLEKLNKYGYTIGCNALYRDFAPDFLVALDRKMMQEIKNSGYDKPCIFRRQTGKVQQPELDSDNVYPLKIRNRQTVNSGVAAVYVALKLGCKDIWLLGFDLSQCNVYAGTNCYARVAPKYHYAPPKRMQPPTQISAWAAANPHIKFQRVVDDKCFVPQKWAITDVSVGEFNELYR